MPMMATEIHAGALIGPAGHRNIVAGNKTMAAPI